MYLKKLFFIFSVLLCLFSLNNWHSWCMEEPEVQRFKKPKILDPLIYAIEHNDPEAIKKVIVEGADPNNPFFEYNPLTWAVGNDNRDLIIFLLEHGANPRQRLHFGKSFISLNAYITANPYLDPQYKTFLIKLFGDPGYQFLEAIKLGYNEFAIKLLNENPNLINGTDGVGSTLLHYAAIDSNAPAIKLLLQWGADINARNNAGKTPLIELLTSSLPSENKIEALQTLLSFGPDLKYTYQDNVFNQATGQWQLLDVNVSALDSTTNPDLREILISHGAE